MGDIDSNGSKKKKFELGDTEVILLGFLSFLIVSLFLLTTLQNSIEESSAKMDNAIQSISLLADENKNSSDIDISDIGVRLSKVYYDIESNKSFLETSSQRLSRIMSMLTDVQLRIKDINKDNSEQLNQIYDKIQEIIDIIESLN